ncbi:MAG: hypothetical protein GKR94_16205 [Gammaproteobacteria bacterium]|nr:hypothetical protein [Gammaproteobacteria bacterium]
MKLNAYVADIGMTLFGKHLESGLKALGAQAVTQALAGARMAPGDIRVE